MKMFQREIESEILKYIEKKGILVILGPRQAGKTTLAKRILERLDAEDSYFNCELAEVRRQFVLGDPEPLRSLIGNRKTVVFDEAQTIANIGKILKVFHDTYPEIKILATGSSAFDLANKIREPLTGRADEFMLYPLSLREVASALPITRERLDDLMRYGSYPAVVSAESVEGKEAAIKRIATNYLYKDVFTFEALRNPKAFEDLVVHLATRVSGIVSAHDLSREVGVAPKTVEHYLRLLEQAFVIKRVYAFSRNHANELKKAYKVYFVDAGVRNTFSGEGFATNDPVLAGVRFESFVFSEFLKQDTLVPFPPRTHFWRTRDKKEIDFVRVQGKTVEAFEAKLSATDVSFKTFLKHYPTAVARVVTPKSFLSAGSMEHG